MTSLIKVDDPSTLQLSYLGKKEEKDIMEIVIGRNGHNVFNILDKDDKKIEPAVLPDDINLVFLKYWKSIILIILNNTIFFYTH
jgi:hypothetical protein